MARLLVRLKLRLLANRLHGGVGAVFGLLLGGLFGLVIGLMVATVLVAGATAGGWGDAVVATFAVAWLGWLVLPLLTFSSDDTLDPRRFSLLPLRARELVPGLLAGGVVGVGGLSTVFGAAGVVGGAGRATGGMLPVVVAVVAVVLLVMACVAWSRALVTLLSDVLSSRRGRDFTALGSTLVLVALVLAPQLLNVSIDTTSTMVDPEVVDRVVAIASWTPGGAAGAAVSAAVAGDGLAVVGRLLLAGAWILLAGVAWVVGLGRLQDRPPSSSPGRTRGRSHLYPRVLGWLPRTRTTAVTVRFLRMIGHDGRVRNPVLSQMFFVLPAIVVSLPAMRSADAPLYAALAVAPFGLVASTQLGLDGPALWQHHVAGDDPRSDLLGRSLAFALLAVPLAVVVAVGLAVGFDASAVLPHALLFAPAVLATLLGVANVGAVVGAQPVPEEASNPFGSGAAGSGCLQGVFALVVIILQAVAVLPVVLATLLVTAPGPRLVAGAGGLAWGLAVFVVGTRVATTRARSRAPELLAAIDPRSA